MQLIFHSGLMPVPTACVGVGRRSGGFHRRSGSASSGQERVRLSVGSAALVRHRPPPGHKEVNNGGGQPVRRQFLAGTVGLRQAAIASTGARGGRSLRQLPYLGSLPADTDEKDYTILARGRKARVELTGVRWCDGQQLPDRRMEISQCRAAFVGRWFAQVKGRNADSGSHDESLRMTARRRGTGSSSSSSNRRCRRTFHFEMGTTLPLRALSARPGAMNLCRTRPSLYLASRAPSGRFKRRWGPPQSELECMENGFRNQCSAVPEHVVSRTLSTMGPRPSFRVSVQQRWHGFVGPPSGSQPTSTRGPRTQTKSQKLRWSQRPASQPPPESDFAFDDRRVAKVTPGASPDARSLPRLALVPYNTCFVATSVTLRSARTAAFLWQQGRLRAKMAEVTLVPTLQPLVVNVEVANKEGCSFVPKLMMAAGRCLQRCRVRRASRSAAGRCPPTHAFTAHSRYLTAKRSRAVRASTGLRHEVAGGSGSQSLVWKCLAKHAAASFAAPLLHMSFSSLSSILGLGRGSVYAASNAGVDSCSEYRRISAWPARCTQWGHVEHLGLARSVGDRHQGLNAGKFSRLCRECMAMRLLANLQAAWPILDNGPCRECSSVRVELLTRHRSRSSFSAPVSHGQCRAASLAPTVTRQPADIMAMCPETDGHLIRCRCAPHHIHLAAPEVTCRYIVGTTQRLLVRCSTPGFAKQRHGTDAHCRCTAEDRLQARLSIRRATEAPSDVLDVGSILRPALHAITQKLVSKLNAPKPLDGLLRCQARLSLRPAKALKVTWDIGCFLHLVPRTIQKLASKLRAVELTGLPKLHGKVAEFRVMSTESSATSTWAVSAASPSWRLALSGAGRPAESGISGKIRQHLLAEVDAAAHRTARIGAE